MLILFSRKGLPGGLSLRYLNVMKLLKRGGGEKEVKI